MRWPKTAALAAGLFAALPVLSVMAQPKPAPSAVPAAQSATPAPSASPSGTPTAARSSPTGVVMAAPPGTAAPAATTTPGAPPAAPGAPPAATPPPPAMDGATYAVRLRDLEERIDQLKEQIRRSHTRLSLLSDTILSGGGAGSRANIRFLNELSGAFKTTRLLIVLDGAVQYNKTDQSGALSEQTEIPIFNGSIPPGDHTVQVLLNLQGSGYGVFSYLRGYRFEVRSSHSFTTVDGKTVNLQAVAYEKGGMTTPIEERPAVRYVEKTVSGLVDGGTAPTPPAVAK
jgi:hypothetical protein